MWGVHAFRFSVLHSESSLRQGVSAGGGASEPGRAAFPGVLGYAPPRACTPVAFQTQGRAGDGSGLAGVPRGYPLEA